MGESRVTLFPEEVSICTGACIWDGGMGQRHFEGCQPLCIATKILPVWNYGKSGQM